MSELIHHFGIDWRLLLAQAVNFLILLYLLKRFAYQPILEVLKKRRREIEKGLEYAQVAKDRLAHVEEERQRAIKKAEEEALLLIRKAESAAKTKQGEIIQQAQTRAERVIADAKKRIAEEESEIIEEIHHNARELVRLGIAKVIGKMPSEKRDAFLIRQALTELKNIAADK